MRRHLPIGLLGGLRPAPEVVAQFVRSEVARREPIASLYSYHLKPGLRERERSDAAHRAEADDYNVGFFKVSGHDRRP